MGDIYRGDGIYITFKSKKDIIMGKVRFDNSTLMGLSYHGIHTVMVVVFMGDHTKRFKVPLAYFLRVGDLFNFSNGGYRSELVRVVKLTDLEQRGLWRL